jgi:hypothetical protein
MSLSLLKNATHFEAAVLIRGSKQGAINNTTSRFAIDIIENNSLLSSYIEYKISE